MKKEEDAQCFTITSYTTSSAYTIYLNTQIREPSYYNELFELFRSVGPNDVIYLHLNCPGGNLVTGQQIINAMTDCQAHIVTVLDGACMSLAPLILFNGDEIIIPDRGMIMFHDFSQGGGSASKGNEMLSGAIAWNDFYRDMLVQYAKPFLSDEEIEKVVSGADVYMNATEIRKRLDAIKKESIAQQEKKTRGRKR
jgi:ATP-dependent protease ClpP protease subunit